MLDCAHAWWQCCSSCGKRCQPLLLSLLGRSCRQLGASQTTPQGAAACVAVCSLSQPPVFDAEPQFQRCGFSFGDSGGGADHGVTPRHEAGYCTLYGTAGHRADHDALDAPNNTRAQPVAGDNYRALQEVCPQLTSENGGVTGRYCCDDRQIHDLASKVG